MPTIPSSAPIAPGRRVRVFIFVFLIVAMSLRGARIAVAATAPHEMVVAESEPAARAGLEILRQGGNAIDAAVATSLALGVTNASSCGLGGGGFMLIYWAKTQKLYALDYREVAPAAARPDMYMRDGKPDEQLARTGALAVAVPGEPAGLDAARRRFGTMKFSQLAAPAIKLARAGFPLNPHMARELMLVAPIIGQDAGFHAIYFNPDGTPRHAGAILHNPNLATLIESLGDAPAERFYHGAIAAKIADFVKQRGGILTAEDLASYRPLWRDPIHLPYDGYDVYTMPPPSSAGVVLEILGMLSNSNLAGLGADSPAYLARLIEVMRQGFIDRAQYADPGFVKVPLATLLSPEHIAQARDRALHHAPAPSVAAAHDHGTSNFAVADRFGNVVEVTTTVNTIFGAKLMVESMGLVLNDEMDDFGVAPGVPNAFRLVGEENNEVAPGKRPLSSMSPLIALKDGRPALAAGGSGGPTIISGVAQVTIDSFAFHLEPETAVRLPRVHQQAQPDIVFVEQELPFHTRDELTAMGYHLKIVPELGAISAIRIRPGELRGAFDPLKGGGAVGD